MELVGDFRSTDPIFKGCYGDSFLYTDMDLGHFRRHGIHLPLYWSEIPAPPAPSYLQAKQPKATKWSPLRSVTQNPAVESPMAKHSSSKGGHHCSLGCSSNTLTLKCPDSTSAKKPSKFKEPAPNKQEKSPLSQSNANRKKSTQKMPMHSTPPFLSAPVHLMASAVLQDPTVM